MNELIDYVNYSLNIHDISPEIGIKAIKSIKLRERSNLVHPYMNTFLEFLNDKIKYDVIHYFHY